MNAIIKADSVNAVTGVRLTTFILPRFPKCLLAEFNTHRMLSRNTASSRAIPVETVIENILTDPFVPTFTRNQKGMVGSKDLPKLRESVANLIWEDMMLEAIQRAKELSELGVAKQEANRLLEPFMRIPVIVTATDWDNFFRLRTAPDTAPDFMAVAVEMEGLYRRTTDVREVEPGGWHVPFSDETGNLKVSTARCARVSYATHDGQHSVQRDERLHDMLLSNGHLSPFEHSAQACASEDYYANFRTWKQYRKVILDSHV